MCRTYWGSHGCNFERGHDGAHECSCCDCPPGHHNGVDAPGLVDDPGVHCVAKPPYYGPGTNFYGEDAASDRGSETRDRGRRGVVRF